MNDLRHKIVAAAADGELRTTTDYRLNSWDCTETLSRDRSFRSEDDGSLRAVPVNQAFWPVDVHAPPVLNDRNPIAQSLALLHQMTGQKNCLAALTDTT